MISRDGRAGQLFPVGLYASLLIALFCLVQPGPARRLQSVCSAVVCLPFRAYAVLVPSAAHAASLTYTNRPSGFSQNTASSAWSTAN